MDDYDRGYNDGLDDGRQALRDYRRSLIEECAGLAVVATLHGHVTRATRIPDPAEPRIPIAPAPPSLAEDVARGLAGYGIPSKCEHCNGTGNRRVPLQRSRCPHCESGRSRSPAPFAAAYSDTPTERRYWLASAACPACYDEPRCEPIRQPRREPPCARCSGTGARTDVGAIARRYGGDGFARSATFEVKR